MRPKIVADALSLNVHPCLSRLTSNLFFILLGYVESGGVSDGNPAT